VLAAYKTGVNSAFRVIAPWVVVIIDVILAALAMWGILRQYGESTADSDGIMPTPWETGRAPYILGLLTSVLVSAILTAAGHRLGRYILMVVTTLYTLCLLLLAAEMLMSMGTAGIPWTAQIALSDFEYLVIVIGWWFISYWSLFRASPPDNRPEELDQRRQR
jgi:hypothetical protein